MSESSEIRLSETRYTELIRAEQELKEVRGAVSEAIGHLDCCAWGVVRRELEKVAQAPYGR